MAVDLGTIVATLAAEVGPFEEGFRAAESRLSAFADMADGIGSLLTTTVSIPLAAVGAIALQAANTFDDAMSTIERRTGASGDSLASLGDQFEKVYAKSNQGAQDLAAGEATLAARTGETGDTLGALLGKLDALADISGGKVAPLATEAVDVFKRWGIASADQGHALDTVSRAAQLSGTSVSTLLDAVAGGAPFLKAMNLDFVSSTALLGSLGKAGVDTGQFVTGLRHALTQMAKEGITDSSDAFRTLIDRIKDANTPLEAISVASAAFGPRVGVQLADAIRSGAFSLSQFKTELLTTTRPIEEITEHSKTLGERWTETWHQFQVAVTPVGIAISEVVKGSLIPAVQSVIEKLAGFGAAFNNLSPETKTRIMEIGAAFIALGPALVLAQTAFGLLVAPITALVGGIAGLVPAFIALGPAFQVVAVAGGAIVVSLTVIGSTFVTLGTVVELFTHNWSTWWAQIKLTIAEANLSITQALGNLVGKLRDTFAALPGGAILAKPFADAADLIGLGTEKIIRDIHELRPVASESTLSVGQAFTKLGTDTKMAVGDTAGMLGGAITAGASAAAGALTASTNTMKGQLATLAPAAAQAGAGIASGIAGGASAAAGAVAQIGEGAFNPETYKVGLEASLSTAGKEALAAGTAVLDATGNLVSTAAEKATAILDTQMNKWHDEANAAAAAGGGTFQVGGGPLPSLLPEAGVTKGAYGIGAPVSAEPVNLGGPNPYIEGLLEKQHLGIDIPVTASGSPKIPLTDYFNSYAPGVLKNFTAGIPGLDFTSNFSDLTSSVRTHLSAGIALGAQGLAADPAQLSNMIASLQSYVATWQSTEKTLNLFGRQDPFGLMAGIRPQDTAAGQAASAGRLLAMLQTLQQQIMGMNSANAANQRTAAAAERTAAGVESLGSAMFTGRFIQGISMGVTRNQRSLYGNPTTRIGV